MFNLIFVFVAQSPENPYSLQGGYDTVTALPPPISVTCQPIHPPPVTYR